MSKLKTLVLDLIYDDPKEQLVPYINPTDEDTKHQRGFNHPVLGALLCPTDYDWDDEEFVKS